jgi:hypothetical protein
MTFTSKTCRLKITITSQNYRVSTKKLEHNKVKHNKFILIIFVLEMYILKVILNIFLSLAASRGYKLVA